jgi:hypothetical protein
MFSTLLMPKWRFFPFQCAECSNRQLQVNLNFVTRGQVLCP